MGAKLSLIGHQIGARVITDEPISYRYCTKLLLLRGERFWCEALENPAARWLHFVGSPRLWACFVLVVRPGFCSIAQCSKRLRLEVCDGVATTAVDDVFLCAIVRLCPSLGSPGAPAQRHPAGRGR